MLRKLVVGATCIVILAVSSNCVTDAKPKVLKCPTTAASVTFYAAGSCATNGGIVTISTNPGLCSINVVTDCLSSDPNCTPILPTSGTFTGDATLTNYDLTQGNWRLEAETSDPAADPSEADCDAAIDGNTVKVSCNISSCVTTGEEGPTCNPSACVLHLTPTADGGLPSLDSGPPDAGTQESGSVDSGSTDSGESDTGQEADSAVMDSGEKDSGQKDSGEKDSGEKDSSAKDSGEHG